MTAPARRIRRGRHPAASPGAWRRGGAGSSTTNLPAACAAEICFVVSPSMPPKITCAVSIARGARVPGTATQSCSHLSGVPSTVSRE